MDILKLYGKDKQSIIAVLIEDAGLQYPIKMSTLHTKLILDGLLESGWQIVKLPFSFVKGSIKLGDLPIENRVFTPAEKQDMLDADSAPKYSEASLMSKLNKKKADTYKFHDGINQIETREAFLDYLDAYDKGGRNLDTEMAYLPLNSFVSPIARFSVEEYFSQEYGHYRNIIEDRRNLSYASYKKLEKMMVEQAPNITINAKTFADFYFQWGFCGMNVELFDRKISHTDFILTASATAYYEKEEHKPYVYRQGIGYLDYSGNLQVLGSSTSRGWKTLRALSSYKNVTAVMEYNELYPVPIQLKESRETTEFIGENISIIYDETIAAINYNSREYYMPTIRVFIGSLFIPYTYIGASKETELFKYLKLMSLADMIEKKATLVTTACSYHALMSTGLSAFGALTYAIYRGNLKETVNSGETIDERTEITGKSKSSSLSELDELDIAKMTKEYLEGNLSTENPNYEVIEEFVWNFLRGQSNIDSTADGYISDNSSGSSAHYLRVLSVAMDILEIPFEELYATVEALTPASEEIIFSNATNIIKAPICKKDRTYLGFKADRQMYLAKQATNASCYGFVKSIWREYGPANTKLRHVGVEMSFLDLSDNKTANALKWIIEKIEAIHDEAIRDNVILSNQEMYLKGIKIGVIRCLFQVAFTGSFILTKDLGGQTHTFSEDVRNMICSYLQHKIDSTVNFSDLTVNVQGNYAFHCVNATVTPYYVIPKNGYTIKEISMAPMWLNTVGAEFDGLRKRWLETKNIPSFDFYGYGYYYKDKHLPRSMMTDSYGRVKPYDVREDPYGLEVYYKEAMEHLKNISGKYKITSPAHPYTRYKALVEDDADVAYEDAVETDPKGYSVGIPRDITRAILFAENPELKEIFEPNETIGIATTNKAKLFLKFKAIDFFYIKDMDDIKVDKHVSGEIAVAECKEGIVVFMDGTRINIGDIPGHAGKGKYKVKLLAGRRYLLETSLGSLWEVEC